jgi:threonine/homoserine/homoserine lactone efflux protein
VSRAAPRRRPLIVYDVDLKLFGEVFITLLVIVDPPGMVPIFLALTGTMARGDRLRAAWQAVALALGVIVVFAVAGQTILDYLHVDLPALQAAGGLLLTLIALELLTGRADDPKKQATASSRWCRWARRCWPAPAPSWRRCCSCSAPRERPTTWPSPPRSWP